MMSNLSVDFSSKRRREECDFDDTAEWLSRETTIFAFPLNSASGELRIINTLWDTINIQWHSLPSSQMFETPADIKTFWGKILTLLPYRLPLRDRYEIFLQSFKLFHWLFKPNRILYCYDERNIASFGNITVFRQDLLIQWLWVLRS